MKSINSILMALFKKIKDNLQKTLPRVNEAHTGMFYDELEDVISDIVRIAVNGIDKSVEVMYSEKSKKNNKAALSKDIKESLEPSSKIRRTDKYMQEGEGEEDDETGDGADVLLLNSLGMGEDAGEVDPEMEVVDDMENDFVNDEDEENKGIGTKRSTKRAAFHNNNINNNYGKSNDGNANDNRHGGDDDGSEEEGDEDEEAEDGGGGGTTKRKIGDDREYEHDDNATLSEDVTDEEKDEVEEEKEESEEEMEAEMIDAEDEHENGTLNGEEYTYSSYKKGTEINKEYTLIDEKKIEALLENLKLRHKNGLYFLLANDGTNNFDEFQRQMKSSERLDFPVLEKMKNIYRFLKSLKFCPVSWILKIEIGWVMDLFPYRIDFSDVFESEIPTEKIYAIKDFKNPKIVRGSDITQTKSEFELQIEGKNAFKLFNLKDKYIDKSKFYCNDIQTMSNLYGIEAGRVCIIKELKKVFDAYGIVIDFRHLSFLGDYMTHTGVIRGFQRSEVGKYRNVLHQMSFESATNFFKIGCITKSIDNLVTPSSNLYLGKTLKLGTNVLDIIPDICSQPIS